MRISDWSSDVCSSDLRPAYRRRPGGGRAIVQPVPPDRPHIGHPQQHGDAAGAAGGPGGRDARDDPPPYPDRLRMTEAAAVPSAAPVAAEPPVTGSANGAPGWQRLHPATLLLGTVRAEERRVGNGGDRTC